MNGCRLFFRKKRKKLSLLSICSWSLLLAAPLAHAEEAASVTVFKDLPIVVTATRTPVASSTTLAPVSILTRQDIEKAQTDSVPDLLRGLPGIDIVQNGAPGSSASVYMRGTNADHVLVLVNGRKLGSATSGSTSWQFLPASQIERIEVVRGPRSTMYGSEALGGVVQIFTRDRGEGLNVDAELGHGTWDTTQGSLTVSGGNKTTNGSLSFAGLYTNGYNSSTGSSVAADSDDDGLRNLSISTKVGHRFARGTLVELDLFRADTRSENDQIFAGSTDVAKGSQQSFGLNIEDDPFAWWHIKLTGGVSRDDSENFLDSVSDGVFNTKRNNVALQNDFTFKKDHMLTLGGDYMEEKVNSSTAYKVSERFEWALFSQYQGSYKKSDWVVGMRRIENEQFGSSITKNLDLGYRLADNLRLTASYGTAVKAPTFNDLYFPAIPAWGWAGGNPDLKPEKSKSFELGAEGRHNKIDWSIRGFRTDIEDLIDSTPANVGKSRITGLELEAKREIGRFDFSGALTTLEPTNITDDKRLMRRAKTTIKAGIGYHFKEYPAHIQSTLLYQSARYNDAANTIRIPSYSTTDITGTYDLDDAWQLRLQAKNIFNKQYSTVMSSSTVSYDAPGRSLFVAMAWRFSQ